MSKLKAWVLSLDIFLVIFTLYSLKLIIIEPSYSSGLTLLVFVSIFAMKEYFKLKHRVLDESTSINENREAIKALTSEVDAIHKKMSAHGLEISQIKTVKGMR